MSNLRCMSNLITSRCDDCKYVKYSFDGGSTKCGYRGKKDCNFIPREKKDLTKDKDINTARKIIKSEAIKEFAENVCKGRVGNDPVVIAVKAELDYMLGVGLEEVQECVRKNILMATDCPSK